MNKTYAVLSTLLLLAIIPCALSQSFKFKDQPGSLSLPEGSLAVFRGSVTGEVSVVYQWYKDGAALFDSERISGVQAAQLSLCPVLPEDAGQYHLVVSDTTTATGISSDPALLSIGIILPVFTNAPVELIVSSGEPVQFSGGATGTPAIVYGWKRNGSSVTNDARVAGADSPTLTISAAQAEDTGWYALTAANTDGIVWRDPARLRVQTPSTFASAANFDEGV